MRRTDALAEFLRLNIGGVVVGFALKAVFDYLIQRRKETREDAHRFLDRKLDAVSALSVAVNEVWTGLPDLIQMQRLNVQMGSMAVQVADLRGQRQTAQPEEVSVLDARIAALLNSIPKTPRWRMPP